MKAITCLLVTIILFVGIPSGSVLNECFSLTVIKDDIVGSMKQYQQHESILIGSDEDFVLQGWPGSGTEEDPFRIENLSITSEDYCIWIIHVSAHFTIRFCSLICNDDPGSGINLRLSPNGSVISCTIQCNDEGVVLYKSPASLVENCTFFGCPSGGVVIGQSPNCKITNNTFSNTGVVIVGESVYDWIHEVSLNVVNGFPMGYFHTINGVVLKGSEYGQIILVNCTNVSVKDGVFSNASKCISVSCCENCSIMRCHFDKCALPIRVFNSSYCTFGNNIMSAGVSSGFYMEIVTDCVISNNNISTEGDAIWVISAKRCVFSNNDIPYAGREGISIQEAQDCEITGNFVNNTGMPGIDIMMAEHCNVTDNQVSYNNGNSIMLYVAPDNIVANNTVGWCAAGITIYDGDDALISDNTIQYSSSEGICVRSSDRCFVERNSIYWALDTGLDVSSSPNCSIRENSISHCQGDGIFLSESENCNLSENSVRNNRYSGIVLTAGSNRTVLVFNNITHNERYGVMIEQSINCTLYGNVLGWNLLGNAVDNGLNNRWDDGIAVGNQWSDWYESLYQVPGTAASVDGFPTLLPSDVTTTPTMFSSTTSSFVITITYYIATGFIITSLLLIAIYLITVRRRH